ncbi:hypothetical protein [Vitiosangium sp. GDMCC 1.1324]|uniref:hypothetical protein n=1 Tax=Vitiosangium sp. (strain GDMCC 1.1324) TaxID=2138576 RepID=UPI000D34EC1C|nr:hypothetical protein [Vitiosangium sp. GDMCC 1.1324]PTL80623.1 hypothetical protein DAT35_28775 [Vitiosangium sp. GDMCC 1.1324]
MARTRKEGRSSSGREVLRRNGMMAHLLDSLDAGQDIGHFGRLVFAMVARYFLDERELRETLLQDPACDERQALALIEQVKGRDYSPPRREKVLQFQAQQEFPLCPNPEDPDACNVYKDLQFPESVYEHITDYREQKAHLHGEDSPAAGSA